MVQNSTKAHFAAQPIQGVWTQVETFELTAGPNIPLGSQMHVLAVITDSGQFVSLSSFYQALYLRLQTLTRYYQSSNPEKFVQSLQQHIVELSSDTQKISLELVVGYQLGGELIVGGCGGASVTLVRGNKLGKILDTLDKTAVVQGSLLVGDILVLSTKQFYTVFPYAKLQQLFLDRVGSQSLETLTSELVVQLQRAQNEAGVGFILSRFLPTEAEHGSNSVSTRTGLAGWLGRLNIGKGKVYLRKKVSRRPINRRAVVIIVVLVGLLLFSTLGAFWQQKRQQDQAAFDAALAPITQLSTEAEFQAEINPLRARVLVSQAQVLFETVVLQYQNKPRFTAQLETIGGDLNLLYQQVSGEVRLTPELFHDLTLIRDNLFVDQMAIYQDRLVLLDTNNHQLVSLGLENKDPGPVLSNVGLNTARFVAGGSDGVYLWSSEGVWFWPGEGVEVETIINQDPDWARIVGFAVFASNVYVLDANLGEIWRYRPIPNNQFSRERWLAPGVLPDFTQAVDMEVDGEIWVLDQSGSVRRYSRGVGQQLEWLGWEEGLQVDGLAVGESELYMLERNKNRALVFSKDGTYLRQFIWEGIGLVTDIAIYQDSLFLVSGEKVYKISLNQ